QVPPENVLRITWPPANNISWTSGDLQTNLLNPLFSLLAAGQLTNQIDYLVLSMDIPYQTINGTTINGTTSALFHGARVDYGTELLGVTNSYAASEQIFQKAKPTSAKGYSFLASMITANTLAQAKQLVDQG